MNVRAWNLAAGYRNMGTFPVPRTSSRNVEREHHGTLFLNAVEHESYIGPIIGTSVPSDYGTSWCVCILRRARP